MKLMVINGPNLSRLDIRDSSIYGDLDYAELKSMITIAATKALRQMFAKVMMKQQSLVGFMKQLIINFL